MASSVIEKELETQATNVVVTDQTITVDLEDGRTVSVPTAWYPRLRSATPKERRNFEITPFGIEWPDVEADVSIRGLLLGHKSGECAESLNFWLVNRAKGRRVTFEDYMKVIRKEKKLSAHKKRKAA
jgi:hypothetical protein